MLICNVPGETAWDSTGFFNPSRTLPKTKLRVLKHLPGQERTAGTCLDQHTYPAHCAWIRLWLVSPCLWLQGRNTQMPQNIPAVFLARSGTEGIIHPVKNSWQRIYSLIFRPDFRRNCQTTMNWKWRSLQWTTSSCGALRAPQNDLSGSWRPVPRPGLTSELWAGSGVSVASTELPWIKVSLVLSADYFMLSSATLAYHSCEEVVHPARWEHLLSPISHCRGLCVSSVRNALQEKQTCWW